MKKRNKDNPIREEKATLVSNTFHLKIRTRCINVSSS